MLSDAEMEALETHKLRHALEVIASLDSGMNDTTEVGKTVIAIAKYAREALVPIRSLLEGIQ